MSALKAVTSTRIMDSKHCGRFFHSTGPRTKVRVGVEEKCPSHGRTPAHSFDRLLSDMRCSDLRHICSLWNIRLAYQALSRCVDRHRNRVLARAIHTAGERHHHPRIRPRSNQPNDRWRNRSMLANLGVGWSRGRMGRCLGRVSTISMTSIPLVCRLRSP